MNAIRFIVLAIDHRPCRLCHRPYLQGCRCFPHPMVVTVSTAKSPDNAKPGYHAFPEELRYRNGGYEDTSRDLALQWRQRSSPSTDHRQQQWNDHGSITSARPPSSTLPARDINSNSSPAPRMNSMSITLLPARCGPACHAGTFVEINKREYFVIRTWWATRLIVDLQTFETIKPDKGLTQALDAVDQQWVRQTLGDAQANRL